VDFDKILPVQIGEDWAEAKKKLLAMEQKCEVFVFPGLERVGCPITLDLGFIKTEWFVAETRAALRVVAIQVSGPLKGDCDSFISGVTRSLKVPWKMGSVKPDKNGMVRAEAVRDLDDSKPQLDMLLRAQCGPRSLVTPSIHWEDAWLIADTGQRNFAGGPVGAGWIVNQLLNGAISADLVLKSSRAQNKSSSRLVAAKSRVALTLAQQNSPGLSPRSAGELRRYVETVLSPGWMEKVYDAEWKRQREEERTATR
jgi:hypothetical protein